MSSASPEASRQRSIGRQKTLLPGVISSVDGRSSFDCAIKDLSATGARLILPASARLEPPFLVINIRDRLFHLVSIAWRSQNMIGVRYLDTRALTASLEPSLQFLKRLWLERAVR
jgi:hypothetical protein